MIDAYATTQYQIHWLVPAENAIGGEAYWTIVTLPHGDHSIDKEWLAKGWFREATITPRRLVAVKSTVLESVE